MVQSTMLKKMLVDINIIVLSTLIISPFLMLSGTLPPLWDYKLVLIMMIVYIMYSWYLFLHE